MKSLKLEGIAVAALATCLLAGCASSAPAKATHLHHAYIVDKHVVYHSLQPSRHCWRHRKHWHCR